MDDQLAFAATDDVRSALASVGRTEDVKFSPDGRRLAIVGYNTGTCLLFDVDMDFSAGRKTIVLRDVVEITSPDLRGPHGLSFLDSETIIVASRATAVQIFRIPPSGSANRKITLPAEPMNGAAAFRKLDSPGSVEVVPLGGNRYDILVCNSFVHCVTRHRLAGKAELRVEKNKVLLEHELNIPDGVAVNRSRRWIAISNHTTGSVLMFRNTGSLTRQSAPLGVLRGAGYPHGVRFTADDQFVLVADAGNPVVHVYSGIKGNWRGARDPATSFQVMNEETYLRGRANPAEGGPKGIDIDDGMNVLVTTCEEVPLAFFDLRAVLKRGRAPFHPIWGNVAGKVGSAWRSFRPAG